MIGLGHLHERAVESVQFRCQILEFGFVGFLPYGGVSILSQSVFM
jgi:hypothetical protein